MLLLKTIHEFFSTIIGYREYLIQSVARDLRKKYKRSALGYFWSMLQPLFMMVILTLVFSHIMKSQIQNFSVFLFCAMIPWAFFDQTCHGCLNIIRANARIIDHVPIPKYVFPLSVAFYNLVNFFITLVPLFIVMLCVSHKISWTILTIPIVLIPLFFFTLGASLLLAVANVFFDDVGHLTDVVLRALYFLCPILYGREHLPVSLQKWVALNPLFTIIEDMRSVIYSGQLPALDSFGYSVIGSIVTLLVGLIVFKKASDKFIYFI